MVRAMALELAPYKINVNVISPGNVMTPMTENSLKAPGALEALERMTPWGRAGDPEDFVGTAVYLASEDSDYVTGIQLPIDGGITCGVVGTKLKPSNQERELS